MSMKKVFFLIFIIFFIIGCDKEDKDISSRFSIDLITNDNPAFFTKTVILFESNDFQIKTNFDSYIDSYPYEVLHGYEEIKLQVIQHSNLQDVLFMTDYLRLPNDSTYILAFHLENGSCLIFDKKKNDIISKIEMEEYLIGEPMSSTVGRRFYIEGDLFLETVDMIS